MRDTTAKDGEKGSERERVFSSLPKKRMTQRAPSSHQNQKLSIRHTPFACSTSSQNGVETWRSGGHLISTTDSALAWSRLALRRGSDDEAMAFFRFSKKRKGKNEKKKKKKVGTTALSSFVLSRFFPSCTHSLPLSLSLSRATAEERNRSTLLLSPFRSSSLLLNLSQVSFSFFLVLSLFLCLYPSIFLKPLLYLSPPSAPSSFFAASPPPP